MIVSIGRGTANVSKRIVDTQRIPFSYGIGSLSRKFHTLLPDRSIIRATGKDSEKLLQNLTTNDVKKINEGEGQLTAFLNPQGRTISFGFLYRTSNENEFYIDLDQNIVQETLSLIKKFKLRSKIVLDDVSKEIGVLATLSANEKKSLISIKDSRSPNMGFRSIVNKEGRSSEEKQFQEYTIHRIKQGIAETSEEIVLGGMPLEENLDLMNGVDFRKGCYIGQELTARTHHTGVIRKRIVPVSLSENLEDLINNQDIQSQTDIQLEGINSGMDVRSEPIHKANTNSEGNPTSPSRGRSAGKLLSCINNVGLAMLRLEQVNRWNKDLTMKVLIGDKQIFVKPFIPNWWPEEAKQPS